MPYATHAHFPVLCKGCRGPSPSTSPGPRGCDSAKGRQREHSGLPVAPRLASVSHAALERKCLNGAPMANRVQTEALRWSGYRSCTSSRDPEATEREQGWRPHWPVWSGKGLGKLSPFSKREQKHCVMGECKHSPTRRHEAWVEALRPKRSSCLKTRKHLPRM